MIDFFFFSSHVTISFELIYPYYLYVFDPDYINFIDTLCVPYLVDM